MPRDLPFVILPEEPLVFDEMGSAVVTAPLLPAAEPVPATDSVTHALMVARETIREEGAWCPLGKGDEAVTFCAAMAVRRAAGISTTSAEYRLGEPSLSSRLWHRAMDALALGLPEGRVVVADYNDAIDTQHADILAVFDRAISLRTAGV